MHNDCTKSIILGSNWHSVIPIYYFSSIRVEISEDQNHSDFNALVNPIIAWNKTSTLNII